MKRTVFIVGLVAVCLLAGVMVLRAQSKTEQLKEYSRVLPGPSSVSLTLVHINDYTAPLLFQPPTLYSMRARAREATMLYVQGTTVGDIELDTTNFTIEQAGDKATASPTSIKNFTRGNKVKVRAGEQIDGLLLFPKKFDPAKPFTVKHDRDQIEFRFTADQVKAMTAPPAP